MARAVHSSSIPIRINHVVTPISIERCSPGHVVVRLHTSYGETISHVMATTTLVALMSMMSRFLNSDLPATWIELNLP
jgi:hypothetical protein